MTDKQLTVFSACSGYMFNFVNECPLMRWLSGFCLCLVMERNSWICLNVLNNLHCIMCCIWLNTNVKERKCWTRTNLNPQTFTILCYKLEGNNYSFKWIDSAQNKTILLNLCRLQSPWNKISNGTTAENKKEHNTNELKTSLTLFLKLFINKAVTYEKCVTLAV